MPRKKIDTVLSGRDRSKDVKAFTLQPLATVPDIPNYFGEIQQEFYVQICRALIEVKQLRIVDLPNIEIAAFWYEEARKAMDDIRAGGFVQVAEKSGWEQIRPVASVLEKASKQLQQFADRYGLNLVSAVKIPKAKSDKNSLDEMTR